MIPISLSEQASKEIKHIFETKNIPSNYALRVGVKGQSGCSGVNYVLGFDEKQENDQLFDVNGIQVVISKKDFMHLLGVKVDFLEDESVRGFVFKTDS